MTSTVSNAMIEKINCNLDNPMIFSMWQAFCAMLMHLDNCTNSHDCMSSSEETAEMATKINRTVFIDGKQHWIHANTEQEYADKLAKLFGKNAPVETKKHLFSEYAMNWFKVYAEPNIQTATATTYKRQITLHLIPYLGGMAIEDITTDDVQRLFNGMGGAKATKDKAKQVLGMILDTAVEDGLIQKNPLKSKRLRITGAASKYTDAYSLDQMRFLISKLDKIRLETDRVYLAIQALHPLRLEEVLGLKWEDVDTNEKVLHIRRAVTHPTRNQPEIKATKTEASVRDIGLSDIAAKHLVPGNPTDFVFGRERPLSYQQVKRMCLRIQADTGFDEKITPIRFRTTVLTDIYDRTRDVKAAQMAAGHTSPNMTMTRYAKGRSNRHDIAAVIDRAYSLQAT